jgi:PAS domain S-box-containing protein
MSFETLSSAPESTADVSLFSSAGMRPEVFGALPGCYLLLTPALYIVAATDAYLAITHTTREQLIGRYLPTVFPHAPGSPEAETMVKLQASLEQVLATGKPHEMPVQYYRLPDPAMPAEAVERYWQPLNSPVLDANGAVCGLIHHIADVTAIRTREQYMARQAERERRQLRTLINQAPVAISFFEGPELVVTAANELMSAMWGYSRLEVENRPLLEAVPELQGQGFDDMLRQVLATGIPVEGTEAPAEMLRDGHLQTTYYNFIYKPIYDASGSILGVMDVAVDVTEQVRRRQQVEEKERQTTFLNAALQAANEEILANNAELEHAHQQLRQLNEQLEGRVLRRTQALHQAQLAAEQEREQLYQVFEQTPVAITILRGANLRVELANPAVAAIWGREPSEVLGRPYFEAMPEIAGQGFEQILTDVLTTGQPIAIVEAPVLLDRAHTGQSTQAFVNFAFQPLRDAHGTITGLLASGNEVTEQVLARLRVQQLNEELAASINALREQQKLLHQILRQVPAAVATLSGPRHQYSFFNTNYQALTANRPTLGQTVADTLPELVEQGFIDLLDKVYATGELFSGTDSPVLLHNPSKSRPEQRYIDFVYQPLTDGQGRTQGILAFIVDTTERVLARKQAETLQAAVLAAVRRQKEERENVFQLFEQSPAVICLLREADHRIDYFNPAYQALFPGQQLRGRTLAQVEPMATGFIKLLDEVYATGTMQLQLGVPVIGAANDVPVTHYFDFTYQAYREQNRIVGVSIFGLDVTEQVLARGQVQGLNEELAIINEELQASNEELGETNMQLMRTNADLDTFVYTASHDLKVPIANIEGLLDALTRDLTGQALGASVTHILELMHESVLRFQQTIGHLTDISRLQQQETPSTEAVSLAAVLADVQLDLAPLLETTGAQLIVDLVAVPELPLSLKNQRSVVYNLLSNALKYRHPDRTPQVHIHCQRHDDTMVLTVQDNGLGVDERQQKRLFGLFQRLHSHVEGSGVGLYMVKKITENAGGTVRIMSQVGVGSTFIVTLPLRQKRLA